MDFSLIGFHGLAEVFNVHPVFVHFPIVLFPLSFLLYLLSLKCPQKGFPCTAQLTLILAELSVIITMVSGLLAEDSFSHNETIHHIMETHEALAYFIVSIGAVVTLWSFFRRDLKPRFFGAFLGLLVLVCVSVLLNADLGGRMVFVHGAAVKSTVPATPLVEHDHGAHGHDHHGD